MQCHAPAHHLHTFRAPVGPSEGTPSLLSSLPGAGAAPEAQGPGSPYGQPHGHGDAGAPGMAGQAQVPMQYYNHDAMQVMPMTLPSMPKPLRASHGTSQSITRCLKLPGVRAATMFTQALEV